MMNDKRAASQTLLMESNLRLMQTNLGQPHLHYAPFSGSHKEVGRVVKMLLMPLYSYR